MNTEKRDFDKEAASWDEHPARVKLAKDIANVISRQIILTPEMDIMDFGCGTGLLTIQLQPLVHSITGIDSSQGMLNIFNTKVVKLKLPNVRSQLIDLDKGDTLAGNYHLIVSSMTLHHIKEIQPLFDQFYSIMAPGGYLCIADLDLDDGQFHEDNTGVFHFGFDRATLRKVFIESGFDNIRDIGAAEVVKPSINGEMRRFTMFLMTGQKRGD
ncbi:MAG: class I SAM-dependent methyltransferase [Proteobacteria bacterium]|nr:class I SAM-dependent methyltransferase [Pseudomonadota bacterium]